MKSFTPFDLSMRYYPGRHYQPYRLLQHMIEGVRQPDLKSPTMCETLMMDKVGIAVSPKVLGMSNE